MRQIYSAIESAFDKGYVRHIQIGAIFGRGGGYDYGEFEERASEELSESEELEVFKTIFFKYYVEVEIKENSNERIDFDYIIDLFIDDIHEDDLKIGWLSPRESDFDLIIEDGVDWTQKEKWIETFTNYWKLKRKI
jgi:hypothetical protein